MQLCGEYLGVQEHETEDPETEQKEIPNIIWDFCKALLVKMLNTSKIL